MGQIIDRRLNGKNKSAVNRQRFINRFKSQIKKALSDAITKRSITDIDRGEKIYIPAKDISEPTFRHAPGGKREIIMPGNEDFVPGDRIKRQVAGGSGEQSQASNTGEGFDDFGFEISREEFLELFFEGLALPNLVKTQLSQIPLYKQVRAGFKKDGEPANINIVRSLRGAMGRRIALANPHKKELQQYQEQLQELLKSFSIDHPEVVGLQEKIALLKNRIKAIPFIDPFDLRYNNRIKQPKPNTQAVMFCIMDVSGSMDEEKKDIAKRFFILLYLFLAQNYEKIQVIYIRHHTSAKEVDEQEFFYSRETGGTVVSSALELLRVIIQERFPTSLWNIYVAQASDGDNWNADSPYCRNLLLNQLMQHIQYYAYVEIIPRYHQSLWEAYLEVKETCPNFAMQTIETLADIYPVLHELFKRQKA